ncbi:hypothetical protein BBJ28_00013146 [Nothophytophthora sp. Chile5]|nr:hypothetical protein BBJ28_00013146 [Nothophytophthora sp. Chile5]
MSRKGLKGSAIGGNDVLTIDQLRHQDDWVLDTERYRCHCGEVVCGNCTLKKEAELPVIGRSLVRVCMSCILSHANGQANPQAPPVPTSGTSSPPPREEQWEAQNFHSPTGNSEGDLTHFTRDFHQPEFDYPLDFSWDHPWPKPPVVAGEAERLEILRSFDIMDTPSEDVFDIICDLASNALKSPIAAVSLLDEDREWFKASVGLAQNEVPRSVSFCAHAIMSKEPMVLSNVAMKNLEDRKNAVAAPLDNGEAVEVVDDDRHVEAPMRSAEPLRGSGIGIANQVVAQPVAGQSQDLVAANAGDGQVTAGPKMETMLMDLLCRTTETQQQLATQQGAMFHTLGQHTADIDKLATAMARMEAKLDAMVE